MLKLQSRLTKSEFLGVRLEHQCLKKKKSTDLSKLEVP